MPACAAYVKLVCAVVVKSQRKAYRLLSTRHRSAAKGIKLSLRKSSPGKPSIPRTAETDAAKSAKLLVVLLPGGRGTHIELGLALGGAAEHVVLVGDADFCLFYKHPKVTQITGLDWMVKLAELADEV